MKSGVMLLSSPLDEDHHWVEEYVAERLTARRATTVEAYALILRQFVSWVADRPGHGSQFHPSFLTKTAVETYLTTHLVTSSISHRSRVKSVIAGFCQWLIEEGALHARNPTVGVRLPSQQLLAPRELSDDQCYVLKELVENDDLRGQALFALGYWAGCRVSDVAHLALAHTHVGPKVGWLHVGYKGDKYRDIDLVNQARQPLFAYLLQGPRKEECPFIFTSQRARRVVTSVRDKRHSIHQCGAGPETFAFSIINIGTAFSTKRARYLFLQKEKSLRQSSFRLGQYHRDKAVIPN